MGDTVPAGAEEALTLTCIVDVVCVVWPLEVTTYVWPVGDVGVPESDPVVESNVIPAGGSADRECVTVPSSPLVWMGGVAM